MKIEHGSTTFSPGEKSVGHAPARVEK